MKGRRLPLGVIVPVLLVGLVGTLATLQYRWLGQVSEAEREQLRRSFTERARDFADDLDLEINRVYATLRLSQADVDAGDWTTLAESFDRWKASATFPKLVRSVYLDESGDDTIGLRRFDPAARSFAAVAGGWPAELEPVRRQLEMLRQPAHPGGAEVDVLRLQPLRDATPRTVTIAFASVNADVPALIIPISPGPMERVQAPAKRETGRTNQLARAGSASGSGQNAFFWVEKRTSHLIVEFDSAYIRGTVLPALAARHFPDPGANTYQVAVLSASGAPLFTARSATERPAPAEADLPEAESPIAPERADVVMPLLTFRPDLVRKLDGSNSETGAAVRTAPDAAGSRPDRSAPTIEGRMSVVIMTGTATPGTAQVAASGGQVRINRPAWRLVLQHGAGSLDAAVTQARRRNLILSFGILAVLSIGIVLVVLNARRSEQLAARQMEFVATVSHELRTPLTVIRSAAQNLSAGVIADPGQTRKYGDLIDTEGRRLTDMVEQVLDYAGLTGNRTLRLTDLVDVGALVDEVVASCQPVVEQSGCTASVSVDEGLLVMGDGDALRRAIQNLVTNALKHAADGRWVGVTANAGPNPSRPEVVVTVSDRGRGIPPSEAPHVFEAFYRGRRAIDQQVHGNGLGLNLVKRIVEAHGGRITLRSAADEGATFTLVLPAAPAGAAGPDGDTDGAIA